MQITLKTVDVKDLLKFRKKLGNPFEGVNFTKKAVDASKKAKSAKIKIFFGRKKFREMLPKIGNRAISISKKKGGGNLC